MRVVSSGYDCVRTCSIVLAWLCGRDKRNVKGIVENVVLGMTRIGLEEVRKVLLKERRLISERRRKYVIIMRR